jgi:hypothetical protein
MTTTGSGESVERIAALARSLRAARVFDLEHPRQFGDPVYPSHRPGTVFTLHRHHEPGHEERRTSAAGFRTSISLRCRRPAASNSSSSVPRSRSAAGTGSPVRPVALGPALD